MKKLSLFIVWPFVAILMLLLVSLIFVFGWICIPISDLKKGEDGKYKMKLWTFK